MNKTHNIDMDSNKRIHIETSFCSLNKHGEELCGDKVDLYKNETETIMVLSDGLGSGVKASILASLTSKIVVTMLSKGEDIQDVVETIASTLPVCSERQIAYSTLTILRIRADGQAYLVEYDNPETIILRKGKPLFVEKTECTIAGKRIKEASFVLAPGDLCVMFSDGVVHAGVGRLLNFGWRQENIVSYLQDAYKPGITAHMLSRQLLSACDNLYMQQPGDDATVAVCRICPPSIAHIMVGPPVEKKDDARIVNLLMSTNGKKIICGGTTSQIVSRVLRRKLKVHLNYATPSVPPTGEIKGVDLVTEGVVTLGRALEYLRRYASGDIGRENQLASKSDGAAVLARILTEGSTGARFFVGRAINPAHQNPDLPIDLNLKLRLVEEIAAILRQLDKSVSVEYY